jgi:hypothetical protein
MENRESSESSDARNASREELQQRLGHAPAAWLSRALENPHLGPREMLLLLRNHAATADLLGRIAADREWTAYHEVRRGLTLHARTPLSSARNLLPHLYWKDWVDVAADPAANPVVRRQAERMLLARLDDLSLGERIALARRATRGLVRALNETHARVVDALLGNPRLIELDVVTLVGSASAGREVLLRVAEHPVWGRRRAVRLELLKRSELPLQTALGTARQLVRRDLRALIRDDRVPLLVRVDIERRLRRASGGRGATNGAGTWS